MASKDQEGDPPSSLMELEPPTCSGCGASPPQTNTNYTLISQKHSWRLVLEDDGQGGRIRKWWCPTCWTKQRAKRKGI